MKHATRTRYLLSLWLEVVPLFFRPNLCLCWVRWCINASALTYVGTNLSIKVSWFEADSNVAEDENVGPHVGNTRLNSSTRWSFAHTCAQQSVCHERVCRPMDLLYLEVNCVCKKVWMSLKEGVISSWKIRAELAWSKFTQRSCQTSEINRGQVREVKEAPLYKIFLCHSVPFWVLDFVVFRQS